MLTKENIKFRQGPCPEGYHIPSIGEWNNLLKYRALLYTGGGNVFNNRSTTDGLSCFKSDSVAASGFYNSFKFSFAGNRNYDYHRIDGLGQYTYLWSSSPYGSNGSYYARSFRVDYLYGGAVNYMARANSSVVRCFSDDYLFPYRFSLWGNGEELLSGNIIFGENLINVVNFDSIKLDGYAIDYWYLSGESSSFNISGTDVTGNVTLYARLSPMKYKIFYNLNGGVVLGENVIGYTVESGDITLINPIRTGYTFIGRRGTELDGLTMDVIIPKGSIGDRSYEAVRQSNLYTITINIDGTRTIITGNYGDLVTKPSNPTKNGYKFIGREPIIPDTMPADDIIVNAVWGKLGYGGYGRRGGSDTKNMDNVGKDDSKNNSDYDTNRINKTTSIDTVSTITELESSYEFAKEKGITTKETMTDAQVDGKLTRIAMAKMLSQYAINVLGKEPDISKGVVKFNDVTSKMNKDYDNGVILAYQLGIMGQNMPNNKFRPNDEVTRAEFATALSRMLYNTLDGEYKSTPKYYIHHMEKLVEEGIITKDDPNMKELRGYVMIMLMRSAK